MNTKKILLNIFSFLLLILLINLVNAQEDFAAYSLPSVELCPCSNQAYKITVQNTGSLASSYTVTASDAAAEWVTFSPSRFILNPGQKGSFSVFVNSVCNIQGDYDLEIFITTDKGLIKVIKQVLKFSSCYDYSLQQGEVIEDVKESASFLQHYGSYSLCKDEQKAIPILITNNENFENRYKLVLDAPEWAELNVNSVSLGAKKSGIVLINFDTKDMEGKFNFKLNAISELGKVQRKKNIETDVGQCYSLDVNLEKEMDVVCSGEDKNYNVIITNSGTLSQNVNLEVEGPNWVNFENDSLQLEPEEEKNIELVANPPEDLSGSFVAKVNAILTDKEEPVFSDIINIEVVEKSACYQASIDAKSAVNNFYKEDFFFAKVKNEGIKKAIYRVSLEGVPWVSASPETLELNPGQTGNLNLNTNPGADVEPGTYGIKINLESNNEAYSKNIDIVLRKENEAVKKLKETARLYQYYIYLLILLVILIILFIKPIKKIKDKAKSRYEKYKVKSERLKALKLAREKRKEEIKEKEKAREKELEKKRKERKTRENQRFSGHRKSKGFSSEIKKVSWKNYKEWIYSLIVFFIFALAYLGHYFRLYNLKYTPIYLRNLFYGYLYYILIGVGIVVILFLLILFYNFISKRKKKRKVKRETKKAEKRPRKKERWYNKPSYVIAIFAPILILIAALAYLNLFDDIKDFIVLYSYYIGLGIIILVVILLVLRFYKPLFKFLKE